MSESEQIGLDDKIMSKFASEIKRLAAEGNKNLQKGNELAALSSYSAIVPLLKSLTQGLFESVTQEIAENHDATDQTVDNQVSVNGYL